MNSGWNGVDSRALGRGGTGGEDGTVARREGREFGMREGKMKDCRGNAARVHWRRAEEQSRYTEGEQTTSSSQKGNDMLTIYISST